MKDWTSKLNDSIKIVNARFIKPIDEETLESILKMNKPILLYEHVVTKGGLISNIDEFMRKNDYKNEILTMGLSSEDIITHGDFFSLLGKYHLGEKDVINNINKLLKR